MQAAFEVEFITPPGIAALGNTRAVGAPEPAPGGLVRHKYERTPPMSTYLVAVSCPNLHFNAAWHSYIPSHPH